MRILFSILLVAGLFLGFLLLRDGPINPKAWQAVPNPGLSGPYAPNRALNAIQEILKDEVNGPEDIAQAPQGGFYTGLRDGRIIHFTTTGDSREVVNTGGRPLGMQVDSNGNIIVADAIKGLLSVHPTGKVTVLADSYQGVNMRFVDDLDIAADGTIWFSDASQHFTMGQSMLDLLEGSATGRLFSYQPANRELTLHMKGLIFGNGVALGPNDEFVLINDTGRGVIARLWLKGDKAGQRDNFHSGLPGHPDNLSFNGTDTFWIAMPSVRTPAFDWLADKPWLRKLLVNLPDSLLPADTSSSMIVGLDVNGNVTHNLQSENGHFHFITSVNQYGDTLYIGSLHMGAVGILPAPNAH